VTDTTEYAAALVARGTEQEAKLEAAWEQIREIRTDLAAREATKYCNPCDEGML
jgi:hypothetical protein